MIFGRRQRIDKLWFAWRPVRFDSGPDYKRWVWLKTIENRWSEGYWWHHPIGAPKGSAISAGGHPGDPWYEPPMRVIGS